jgi:hypothetical protein
MPRQRLKQIQRSRQYERQDQPVRLGEPQRALGRLARRAVVIKLTVGEPGGRWASTTVSYPATGAVPSSTPFSAISAPAGSPSARHVTDSATAISPATARPSGSAASAARASLALPARACVASIQPVTWLASAGGAASRDRRLSAAMNSSSASWLQPRAARSIPVARCSSSLMPGPVSDRRARDARRSHVSPSLSSAIQISLSASVTSAGAAMGSTPQPCRSASAIASRQRRTAVANERPFEA